MSDVRVTYSGLIGLLVTAIGAFTGLLFLIVVTRKLSPDDFALWILILPLLSYVTVIQPIIDFWVTRQIARGEEIGKTSVFTSGIFGIGGTLAYFVIIILVSSTLKINFDILLLSSILVPIYFLNSNLSAICVGFKPQGSSFGQLALQISKVPIGFILVYSLNMGIEGAIITLILAESVRLIFLTIIGRNKILGRIKAEIIKFWFRLSWFTLFQASTGAIRNLDVLIFSFITGSITGLAYWGAAKIVGDRIGQIGVLSIGLYPKLLAKGKKEFAEENLKIILYFGIPILAGAIIFAKPFLHILNPLYIDSINILIILSIRSILAVLVKTLIKIIQGYETVDLDTKASAGVYLKSKLFLVFLFNHISNLSYLIALFIILFLFKDTFNLIEQLTAWSLIFLIPLVPFFVYLIKEVKDSYGINFPYVHSIKISGIALISSLVVFYISEFTLIYSESIWEFLPQFIPLILLGSIMFFGISFILDNFSRKFLSSVFRGVLRK